MTGSSRPGWVEGVVTGGGVTLVRASDAVEKAIKKLEKGDHDEATGARIVATVAKQLAERGGGRALVSICTAGGMGVVAIVER